MLTGSRPVLLEEKGGSKLEGASTEGGVRNRVHLSKKIKKKDSEIILIDATQEQMQILNKS